MTEGAKLASPSGRHLDYRQFLRFCAVGGVGFLIDAGVLTVATHGLGLDPLSGRAVSFAAAVIATFVLNRYWAFQAPPERSFISVLARYIGVQGIGFLCNFCIYTLLYFELPAPLNAPLICLTVASVVALLVNYAGARLLVFKGAGTGSR